MGNMVSRGGLQISWRCSIWSNYRTYPTGLRKQCGTRSVINGHILYGLVRFCSKNDDWWLFSPKHQFNGYLLTISTLQINTAAYPHCLARFFFFFFSFFFFLFCFVSLLLLSLLLLNCDWQGLLILPRPFFLSGLRRLVEEQTSLVLIYTTAEIFWNT